MKRKLFLALLSVIVTAACVVGLAACEKQDEQNEQEEVGEHIHTFSAEWSFDETYHWHAAICEHTAEVGNKGKHILKDGGCSVCGVVPVGSEGLEYKLSADDTYKVTGFDGIEQSHVIIPSYYEGLPVTAIGSSVFKDCVSLESVTIPGSVTAIGDSAFEGCFSLTSITLPDGLTSIGESAFEGCSALISITIPEGVTSIGDWAFLRCYKLIEVYNLSSLDINKGSSYYGYVASNALDVFTSRGQKSNIQTTDEGYIFYENARKHMLYIVKNYCSTI